MTTEPLSQRIRDLVGERHYRDSTANSWQQLDDDDARSLLDLAAELRLSENQLRDLWQWAEEIADRDRTSIHSVLAHPTMLAVQRLSLNRNDTIKQLKSALRRLRLPHLTVAEERARRLMQDLQLPRNARPTLPVDLEGNSLRIEVEVTSADALRRVAQQLLAAADRPACRELFELLDGV